MKKQLWAVLGCAGLLMGCANEVIIEESPPASSGGGNGGTSSSGTSSSTSGGPSAVCVPVEEMPPWMQPTCADLDRLVLVNPEISNDTDGDGLVERGEKASLTVVMKDVSGRGFNWYPGVEFASKGAAVSVQADTWYYAILQCGELPTTGTIEIAPDASPGTTVMVRAQIAMLNEKCTNAFAIDVPINVH